jgi:hypothetical protein
MGERRAPSQYIADTTGRVVGMFGLDGREYLFPETLNASAPASGSSVGAYGVFDSDTGAPIGLVSPGGDRYFPEALTLAPPTGARRAAEGVQELVTSTTVIGLLSSAAYLFPEALTGAPADPGGAPANTALPSILTSPLVIGTEVEMDGGEWDGTFDYIEVRLQSGSTLNDPQVIYLDWSRTLTDVAEGLDGAPCYIAARPVVGGVPIDAEAVISAIDYGPWEAPFVPELVISMPIRATAGFVSDFPEDTPWLGGVYPTTLNGIAVGHVGTALTNTDRNTGVGSRLAGTCSFSVDSRRFRMNVPNGDYTMFYGARFSSGISGSMEVWDGNPDAGGTLLFTLSGTTGNTAKHANNAETTIEAWNTLGAGNGRSITIASGNGLYFKRLAGTSPLMNYVGIYTREA